MSKVQDEPVVFLDAAGNEISNDPRWKAQKLQAQVQHQQFKELVADTDEDEDLGDDEEPKTDYASMTPADVKKIAGERGIDIKGLRKKSEVIALLVADDEAKASEDAGEGEGEGSDEDEEN